MKNLGHYLRFEAEDKKGIENASHPETMIAHVSTICVPRTRVFIAYFPQVPTQDNYCDCGLYLLHFAKVFMEDPTKSFHTILVSTIGAFALLARPDHPSVDEAEVPKGRPRR